jgi:hypothetical protein
MSLSFMLSVGKWRESKYVATQKWSFFIAMLQSMTVIWEIRAEMVPWGKAVEKDI